MKAIKRALILCCCLALMLDPAAVFADDSYNMHTDGYSTSYTYGYDYWGDVQESPDAYRVRALIDLNNLPIKEGAVFSDQEALEELEEEAEEVAAAEEAPEEAAGDSEEGEAPAEGEGEAADSGEEEAADAGTEQKSGSSGRQALSKYTNMFIRDNDIYVVDTNKSRILVIRYEDHQYQLIDIIETIEDSDKPRLNLPSDVFVDPEGHVYVADTENQRVIMIERREDNKYHLMKKFTKPDDSTFDQDKAFKPRRIVVDSGGRVYALVANVNKGITKYEADESFTGFIGANPVRVNMAEYIWKRYFMTKEQRAASASNVSTEYENIYIDNDNFIYTTTINFSEYDLKSDVAKPIRRLNGLGTDILVKNDHYPPIGDLWWSEGEADKYGPSRLIDITVLERDTYVVLDRVRGRLFGYDDQGVMLWAFGSVNNIKGAFSPDGSTGSAAAALDHMGTDLLVLDGGKATITVFMPTEYGNLIYSAIEQYHQGDYDGSADTWRDVLKMNANYPLAFRGIGRAIMREDRFEDAMEYFKMAHDQESYGRAFKLYRKIWVEKNIGWIVAGLALILIVPLAIGRVKKMKWEVIMHEHSKVRKNG